jgi:hypothetical protein
MHLPTPAECEALKLALFHIFDLILWVLAMVTVLVVALKHIPGVRSSHRKERKAMLRSPSLPPLPPTIRRDRERRSAELSVLKPEKHV